MSNPWSSSRGLSERRTMTFFDTMFLSPETKTALDWGLFRMYILGPAFYYGLYRALLAMADHYINKYTKEDQ